MAKLVRIAVNPGRPKMTKEEARRLARKNLEEMTDGEDAAITAAAEADPDNPPLDDAMLAKLRSARPRGRPPE